MLGQQSLTINQDYQNLFVLLHSGGAVYMTLTFMVTPVKYEKKMLLNDPSAVNGKFCFFLFFFSIIV